MTVSSLSRSGYVYLSCCVWLLMLSALVRWIISCGSGLISSCIYWSPATVHLSFTKAGKRRVWNLSSSTSWQIIYIRIYIQLQSVSFSRLRPYRLSCHSETGNSLPLLFAWYWVERTFPIISEFIVSFASKMSTKCTNETNLEHFWIGVWSSNTRLRVHENEDWFHAALNELER